MLHSAVKKKRHHSTIDWPAHRAAVNAALAQTRKPLPSPDLHDIDPSSDECEGQYPCHICSSPITRLLRPQTGNPNPLELGLCISADAHRQLEAAVRDEFDMRPKYERWDGNRLGLWTVWIGEQEQPNEGVFKRRCEFSIKLHLVPAHASSGLGSSVKVGTATFWRQKDAWPCVSIISKDEWSWLRGACLDGKKVRCSVSNLRRTLKVEAVLRALCKVDKAEVVRRKMHLARDTEATENVQVRLCVEEDRKLASLPANIT